MEEWAQRFEGGEAQFEPSGFANGAARLPLDIETTIYRVVQEALTNVLRHAKASRVDVLLARSPAQVLITVEDNGIGFAADEINGADGAGNGDGNNNNSNAMGVGRLGLVGMQERAALVNGTLEIESSPGQGTTVFLRIPLPPPGANARDAADAASAASPKEGDSDVC